MKNKIVVVGVGLIGGSFALDYKAKYDYSIVGIDLNKENLEIAKKLNIIDEIGDWDDCKDASIIIISTSVDTIYTLVEKALNLINDNCIVFDVGSIKHKICEKLKNHPKRKNFIALHTIAGTEFSGAEAAIKNLFQNKVCLICDAEKSDKTKLDELTNQLKSFGLKITYMNSEQHDVHIAYVSHLSHISSFMLGKTVLEIEKDEKNIFNMAGSGFSSTVRLAKSEPNTWVPIFLENKKNILKSLYEYIDNLINFKNILENKNKKELFIELQKANYIKKILKSK